MIDIRAKDAPQWHDAREGSMTTMATISALGVAHWGIVLIALGIFAVNIVAAATILNKAGYSRWWCLLLLVPVVNVIGYWVFAFARWPNLKPTLA